MAAPRIVVVVQHPPLVTIQHARQTHSTQTSNSGELSSNGDPRVVRKVKPLTLAKLQLLRNRHKILKDRYIIFFHFMFRVSLLSVLKMLKEKNVSSKCKALEHTMFFQIGSRWSSVISWSFTGSNFPKHVTSFVLCHLAFIHVVHSHPEFSEITTPRELRGSRRERHKSLSSLLF